MGRIAVIGSGFAGLSASAMLAKNGLEVHLFEKNGNTGGRARSFHAEGFRFDMGPSWYWMPDVFERFFNHFGHTTSDLLDIQRLDPAFTIIFNDGDELRVPGELDALTRLFESIEEGGSGKLRRFLSEAAFKYHASMDGLIYNPGLGMGEYLRFSTISKAAKLHLFRSHASLVRKYFSDPRLIALLEFPVFFLGATPKQAPALFSMLDYAGLVLGTWYPQGGFGKLGEVFAQIAEREGVSLHLNAPVTGFGFKGNAISEIHSPALGMQVDAVVGAADYQHVEKRLLPEKLRSYSDKYWSGRVLAPSCLIFYLGINKKLKKLDHHNLFFDGQLDEHARDIYQQKKWPEKPLFYVCCPSKTDPGTSPEGMENLFVLMPIAPGLDDGADIRDFYYDLLLSRLEKYTGEAIKEAVVFKRGFCISDFKEEYNAFRGNAYGLANTLWQTAVFKPKMRSKKVKNLFYAGQMTVPGPGVPPAVISGEIAAKQLLKTMPHVVKTTV